MDVPKVRRKKSKADKHQASQDAGTYLSEGFEKAHTQKAGTYLSEGRYGCVYLPPLDCKANTVKELKKNKGKSVGKLTSISEATQSVNASIVLRGIPNADNYFILINSICEPKESIEKKDCEPIHNEEQVAQISMAYGGITLEDVRQKHLNLLTRNFMGYMGHILESGVYLLMNNLVHFDLHRKNIVVQDVPRIIDLGFIWSPTNLNKNNFRSQLRSYNPLITQESPEASYVNGRLPPYEINKALLVSDIIQRKPSCKILEHICGISLESQEKTFEKFLNSSIVIEKEDAVEFFKIYWTKFDAWGFGTILAHILYDCMFDTSFVNNIYKPNKIAINSVVKGLLNSDPVLRLDAIEALQIWNPNSSLLKEPNIISWISKQSSYRLP
jgi:hypothetical protein